MTNKAEEIAQVSVKGSFNYLWGLVISTIISSVGTIIVGNWLGSYLYGLYTTAVFIPTFLTLLRDWGVNSAMVRFTAQYRAEGRLSEIKGIIMSGVIFEIALGLILTVISFVTADFWASIWGLPIVWLIQISSFSIFGGGLIYAATATFTGFEQMSQNSIMLVSQSVIKTILTLGIAFIGIYTLNDLNLAVSGVSVGLSMGAIGAGIIGFLLILNICRKLPKQNLGKLEIKKNIKILIRYGMAIYLYTIIFGSLTSFYNIILPLYYKIYENGTTVFTGNYGVAVTFVVLIAFFATPITQMLFPAFSKLDYKKEKETLKIVYQASVKYASFVVIPVTAAVMCLAEPGISVLFVDYPYAALYLSLLAITYLFCAFGYFSTTNLLNSQGYQSVNLKLTILTACIGFPLGYFLIMRFGVMGLIITTIVQLIPNIAIGLYWIKKKFDVSIDWRSSGKILLASAIPGVITYFVVSNLNFSALMGTFISSSRIISFFELIVGLVVFLTVWAASTLLLGVVSKTDLATLRSMSRGIGFVGKILIRILNLAEKLMNKLPSSQ